MPSKKDLNNFFKQSTSQEIQKPIQNFLISNIIWAIIFGFLGGCLVFILFFYFLGNQKFFFFAEKETEPLQISEKIDSEKFLLPKEKEDKTTFKDSDFRQISGATVMLYKSGGRILEKNNFLTYGLVLTSDGWVVFPDAGYEKKNLGVIWNRQFYPAQKVALDTFLDLVFIKIDVSEMPVLPVAKIENIKIGDSLFACQPDLNCFFPRVLSLRFVDNPYSIHSSEKLDVFLKTENLEVGLPLINTEKALVGLHKGDGQVIKMDLIFDSLNKFLKNGKIERPFLGVNYLDLSSNVFTGQPALGALLKSSKDIKAVLKKSPAEKIGLKEGDIILGVEKFDLNQNLTLAEALINYSPNTKINLRIWRDGQEQKLSVSLEEKK